MAELNCLAGSGAILYSPEGNYGSVGVGGSSEYIGGGGMGGGGTIWSSCEQVIWISVNSAPKYPIYLSSGWNDVHFWIPFIFPDEEWVEAPIIIEAPGYILIPAGFEIDVKTDEDAPVQTGNPKMTDKLKFVDVYDYDLQSIPVPVDLDDLIDELVFEDTHSIDIVAITNILDEAYMDELVFEDTHSIDIVGPPFSGEFENVDEITLEDVTKTELINVTISDESYIESLSLEDVSSFEIEGEPFSGEFENTESISFTDINENDTKHITISSQSESENVGFDDFVEIETN